ncbi:MAG TPA: biotin/lipoyl-containing protein, partial [Puia sp.]
MALLHEIQVPLLAVNDTCLTVVEVCFAGGSAVRKGDLIMVFETSKTTYDVEAASDGYIQYLCEPDHDYEVNTVVARIYSEAEEVSVAPAAAPVGAPLNGAIVAKAMAAQPTSNWEGETLFSREATRLMAEAGIAPSVFAGRDLVNGRDVQEFLKPVTTVGTVATTKAVAGPAAGSAVAKTASPSLPVDPQKVIVERLSSGKKREIEYLGDVQSSGLTSTLHTWVETDGIFVHVNRSLKYLKDSLLPVIIYEVARLLEAYPLLNAYFTGD